MVIDTLFSYNVLFLGKFLAKPCYFKVIAFNALIECVVNINSFIANKLILLIFALNIAV